MQESITPSDQLQLAALVFPVIALVVNFSINSVEDDDDWWYRVVVGALGIGALGPSLVVLGLAVVGFWFRVPTPSTFAYLGISLVSMGLLSIIVLVIEVLRGLDRDEDEIEVMKVLIGLGTGVLLLAIVLNQL